MKLLYNLKLRNWHVRVHHTNFFLLIIIIQSILGSTRNNTHIEELIFQIIFLINKLK